VREKTSTREKQERERESVLYRPDTRERTDSVWEITLCARERESGMKMGWDWRACSISRCVWVGLFPIPTRHSCAGSQCRRRGRAGSVRANLGPAARRWCHSTVLLWHTRRQALPTPPLRALVWQHWQRYLSVSNSEGKSCVLCRSIQLLSARSVKCIGV